MDFALSKKEKQLVKITERIIKKWRKNLQLDPLWNIDVTIMDGEEMEGAIARIDSSNSAYYSVTIEITNDLLYLPEDKFEATINDFICHELIHIASIDFYRTALLSVENNDSLAKELKYKYEQFTSRFQKAFVEMDKLIGKNKGQFLSNIIEDKEKE